MELIRLKEQNPYWENVEKIKGDPHLEMLASSPREIVNPVEKSIDLKSEGVFIIRGPRQIGKTTFLKRTIRDLIKTGTDPRRILYFAFDIGGLRNEREVFDLIKTYISWVRDITKERVWIFLDEVTYTPNWAVGLKAAYDGGLLRKVTCIATGSSGIDLKKGGERLPGRRGDIGEKVDLLMLPVDFRTFLKLFFLEGREIPSMHSFKKEDIYNLIEKVSFYGDRIKEAFDVYLLVGGYPLSINSYLQKSIVDNKSYYTYLQAILGDLAKIGKKEVFFREIASTIVSKKLEPVDWQTISQTTSIGSHSTVQSYIEDLTYLFVFEILYPLKFLGGRQISFIKRRKIYFTDPFIFHTLNSWCAGSLRPFDYCLRWLNDPDNKAKLAENVAITHLKKIFPQSGFWRNKEEIDFIGFFEENSSLYLEVKYQNRITSSDKRALKKVKGGIILSRDFFSFDKENNILIVPLSYFLALLESR